MMKFNVCKGLALAFMVGFIPTAIAHSIKTATIHSEQQAMASLGYQVVAKTHAYPKDKYAMPEPFSSEPLVIYTWKGLDYETNATMRVADSQ